MSSEMRTILTRLLSIDSITDMKDNIAHYLRDISPLSRIDVTSDDGIDISFLQRSNQTIDVYRNYTAEEFFKELFAVLRVSRANDQTFELEAIDTTSSSFSSSSQHLSTYDGVVGRVTVYSIVLSHETDLYHANMGYFRVRKVYSTYHVSKHEKQSYETHHPLLSSGSKKTSIKASLYFIMKDHDTISESGIVQGIMNYPFENPFEFESEIRKMIRDMSDIFLIDTDDEGVVWYTLRK